MKIGKEGLTLGGALVAGLAASACCIGPVILAVAGIGGAAFSIALEPYRPYLVAATLLMLGAAFYFVYREPKEEACADGECRTPSRRRGLKILLWVVTAVVLAALAFPYYAPAIF